MKIFFKIIAILIIILGSFMAVCGGIFIIQPSFYDSHIIAISAIISGIYIIGITIWGLKKQNFTFIFQWIIGFVLFIIISLYIWGYINSVLFPAIPSINTWSDPAGVPAIRLTRTGSVPSSVPVIPSINTWSNPSLAPVSYPLN